MFNLIGGWRYVVVAVAVLVVVGVSAWGGYRVARADCADRELEVARAYALHSDAVAEFARKQAEDAAQRVAAVRRARAEALSRVGELERELANLPHRPDADWTPDELRALGALREAYSADRRSELPTAVRGDAGGEQSAAGVRPPTDGLGLKLQQPSR